MRHKLEEILKHELRTLAIVTRDQLNYTQNQMAQALRMSESSYSDIETGRSMCGALTTVLLLSMQEDTNLFIQSFYKKVEALYEKELELL